MKICSIDGCDIQSHCRGWCEKHYARWRKHGDTSVVKQGGRPKIPGGYLAKSGYVQTFANGRHVLMHRLVMENLLGRPLRDNENVHHINGVKHDNRPENLELWVTTQPKGQRPSDLVEWAEEILRLYKEECS